MLGGLAISTICTDWVGVPLVYFDDSQSFRQCFAFLLSIADFVQSEASADAATDSAAASGNAALSQAAGTASAPPELPTANGHMPSTNGHLPSANGLTPAAQKAIPKGQDMATPPGSAPLKGVPALPECRVKLVMEADEAAASQIRQAESQHPSKAEAEYRDAEGMYSPEQPFWGVLSDARNLASADSDRQVRY